jgi:hypothetical protein
MKEDRMHKMIFTAKDETKRKSRKGWREEVERDLQVLGVRRWRELVIGKNREVLLDRPKPTAGCSANGRRKKRRRYLYSLVFIGIIFVNFSQRITV